MEKSFLTQEVEMVNYFCNIKVRFVFSLSLSGLEQLCPICDKLRALMNVLVYTCLIPLTDSYKTQTPLLSNTLMSS
jgi:hypothetical protein